MEQEEKARILSKEIEQVKGARKKSEDIASVSAVCYTV